LLQPLGISQLYLSLFIDGEVYKQVPLTQVEQQKHTLNENDLLYGESSLVRSGIARTVCVTKNGHGTAFAWHTRRLKIDQYKASSPFLAYLLELDETRAKVESVATQTALTGITTKDYFGIYLSLPALETQIKIAKVLSNIDDLIDQTQNLIDKYTAVKRGMMADLFSRGIDLFGTPETNKNYGQLRPSVEEAPKLYQETELGWVPKDWVFNNLGSYIEKYLYGPRFDASMYSDDGNVKTIRGTDFTKQGNIKYEQVPIAEIPFLKIRHHILKAGDLVVVTTADCGLTAVFEEQPSNYIASAYAVKLKLSDDAYPYFIKAYMQTYSAETQVNKYVRQGTLGNLPGSDILRFHIALPSLIEQKAIVDKLDSIDELIEKEKIYSEKLKLKKKGLMQDLLTGKVKVN
jgi:type I restriction enzyme S subunit